MVPPYLLNDIEFKGGVNTDNYSMLTKKGKNIKRGIIKTKWIQIILYRSMMDGLLYIFFFLFNQLISCIPTLNCVWQRVLWRSLPNWWFTKWKIYPLQHFIHKKNYHGLCTISINATKNHTIRKTLTSGSSDIKISNDCVDVARENWRLPIKSWFLPNRLETSFGSNI